MGYFDARIFDTFTSTALLLLPILPANSDDIPVLNVEPVCRGIAEQASDPSERGGPDLTVAACIKSEQEVRGQLAKQWSTFTAADKDNCVREAKAGVELSYTDLLACLEMARDVREMKN